MLAHERTHFAGEILGTELEGRLARTGYRDYVLTGYSFRNPWTSGAPEEILATHTEVNRASTGALKKAAKAIASRAPAGYSEWALARDKRQRLMIEATIAARMVPGSGTSATWPTIERREAQAVPLYWHLGAIWLPPFLRRTPARITPRAVRHYRRRHGFKPVSRHTSGHHCWFERDGVIASYSIQGGDIPKKEQSPLAKSLGFNTPIEFRRAIAVGDPPRC